MSTCCLGPRVTYQIILQEVLASQAIAPVCTKAFLKVHHLAYSEAGTRIRTMFFPVKQLDE